MKVKTDVIFIIHHGTINLINLNPGIVINDMIINNLIEKGKTFFDFLKGTERYKYDLGGQSVQLYDLQIKI